MKLVHKRRQIAIQGVLIMLNIGSDEYTDHQKQVALVKVKRGICIYESLVNLTWSTRLSKSHQKSNWDLKRHVKMFLHDAQCF